MQKWRSLAPVKTRLLLDAVVQGLVPILESAGFQRVDFVRQDPASPTSGKEIVLERASEDHIDSVVFNFDKYHRPRFQVHCSRRELKDPNDIIRSANLVKRNSQYYHFWGKAWWLPMSLWPSWAAARAVERVKPHLEQLTRFLESGELGPNISRRAYVSAAASAT